MYYVDLDIIKTKKDIVFKQGEPLTARRELYTTQHQARINYVSLRVYDCQGWTYTINVATKDKEGKEQLIMKFILQTFKGQNLFEYKKLPRTVPANSVIYVEKGSFYVTVDFELIISINEDVPFMKGVV